MKSYLSPEYVVQVHDLQPRHKNHEWLAILLGVSGETIRHRLSGLAEWHPRGGRNSPPGPNTALVITLRRHNPCMTGSAIALQVGISRERVRQILARDQLPTSSLATCRRCHRQIIRVHSSFLRSGMCRRCSRLENMVLPPVYADLPCDWCGRIVHKQISMIQRNLRNGGHGRVFCNRQCFGRWLGHNHKPPRKDGEKPAS